MLLVPVAIIALFMLGASLCERIGKWSIVACSAIAINAPLIVTFFFLGIQEDTAPWQEVVVGLLILLLFVTPVVALRAIAGGEETEQEG